MKYEHFDQLPALVAEKFVSAPPHPRFPLTSRCSTDWLPPSGETHLVEIVYPQNRIVVDYGAREELVLLDVLGSDGTHRPHGPTGRRTGGLRGEVAQQFHGEIEIR